jgi:hypothetical protein
MGNHKRSGYRGQEKIFWVNDILSEFKVLALDIIEKYTHNKGKTYYFYCDDME